jgi:AhpD family alkylhydroperoxidase
LFASGHDDGRNGEQTMQTRLNPFAAAPETMKILMTMSEQAIKGGIEHSLAELVKIRASQINGCANCLHMHTKDARAAGETEARLYLLSAWRESRLYTARERAALEWTEALTRLPDGPVPDEVYDKVKAAFTPKEMVELTMLVITINAWNRVAVGFSFVHPEDAKHAAAA